MSIQIFILSKLMEDNSYPYKLKKQLAEPIPFDQLGGLTESKLYYHFESLAKKGFVEVVEIIKEEHRPDKQIFEITEKGREALPKLIYKLFENADDVKEMVVGLANLKYVNRDDVIEIMKKKLQKIKGHQRKIDGFEERVQIDNENERFIEFLSSYISNRVEHTIYWLEELIKRLEQDQI